MQGAKPNIRQMFQVVSCTKSSLSCNFYEIRSRVSRNMANRQTNQQIEMKT